MLRSLYSAVSGIDVNQKSMDVIGNNIANVNTIGFKTGRAVFQDMLSQTLTTGKTPSDSRGGINPRQVGSGAYLVAVDNIFEQGVIKVTARPHDLAIEGKGFFVVRGEGSDRYYTRAGDFNFDRTGYLVTPSGYRVQGWMSDPVSGVLLNNIQSRDVFISDAHKTMQAKATTQINYAGILDTKSQESMYDFEKMLTQASETHNIFSLLTKDGTDLDLRSNDKVRVKAHIALTTGISDIANSEGQPINMVPGKAQLTMTVGGTLFTLSYVSTAGAIGNGNFSTVQDLIDELNFIFSNNPEFGAPGDTVASLSGGKLTISCDPATPSFKIDSFSATSGYLNNILLPLQGTYSGNSKESNEMFFQQDLNVGNDFKSLGELAAQIDGVINGSVISGGEFRAEYLDNNFGLRNGDQVEMYINGNLSTFTYRGGTADPALNEFHTVNDFAQLMRITAGGTLTVRVTGNSFDVQVVGAGPVTISGITTLRAPAFTSSASPYLEGVLSVLEGAVLDPITPVVRVDEISGKGRISYSMDSGSTQTLSGFTVYNLTDGNFDDNIMVFDPGHRTGATLLPGQSTASYQFFTNATEDTLLLDLFNKQGQSFAFTEGVTTMNFNASIDNKPLTAANSYTVDINSTVNDMMNALEVYLGLGPSFNMKKNVTIMDGIMYVVGEKGAANNIKGLNLSAEPQNTYNIFTNFGVSVSNTQDASGGRFVTDMTIYDGQGNEHDIKFDFAMFNYEKNEWSVRISCDDPYAKVRLEGVTTNELIIRFNADGTPSYMYDRYAVPMHIISNPTLSFSPGNGSSPMSGIALHLGTTGKYDGFVISNARNSLTRNDQDGNALGVLMEKLFNPAGEIVGYYSNGQIRILGQVALATFENNQGLLKVGDTMFAETGNSGQAVIGTPQSGSRGGIASSALENSNVDLSAEFVNMIITERGFQANSRVVTTSDEMIQELLNMKR